MDFDQNQPDEARCNSLDHTKFRAVLGALLWLCSSMQTSVVSTFDDFSRHYGFSPKQIPASPTRKWSSC